MKQPKLENQWAEGHWVGKTERSDEHCIVDKEMFTTARAIRRKIPEEQWDLESLKMVAATPWKTRSVSTRVAPAVRRKYITEPWLKSTAGRRAVRDAT